MSDPAIIRERTGDGYRHRLATGDGIHVTVPVGESDEYSVTLWGHEYYGTGDRLIRVPNVSMESAFADIQTLWENRQIRARLIRRDVTLSVSDWH